MAAGKSISLFLVFLASTSVFPHSYVPQSTGRKLFGGYRIVPKACKPTIPSRVKSNEPAICMFNYECSRRNGEVVGACMDGFLFGACCQLPSKNTGGSQRIPTTEELLSIHDIDHVPEIPILLNPDGTPVGMTTSEDESTVKTDTGVSNHLYSDETTYTKISTFTATSTTRPVSIPSHIMDSVENAEKPQLPIQSDISQLEDDFPALLGQQSILDDLGLPGLLSHSDSNNDIQDHQDHSAVNPVTTLLSPDQILQIADPVDQLPALFSQGLGQSNHSSADTILLNANGTLLDETHNPDELFKPVTGASVNTVENKRVTQTVSSTERTKVTESLSFTEKKKNVTQSASIHPSTSSTHWVKFPDQPGSSTIEDTSVLDDQKSTTSMMTKLPVVSYANTQKLTSIPSEIQTTHNFEKTSTIEERVSTKTIEILDSEEKTTTPMTTLSDKKDELVRVPTITYDAPLGNKKNDVADKEEIAINHIISILNNTTTSSDHSVTVQGPNSSIHKWVSIDETSKPSSVKSSTARPSISTLSTSQTFPYTFYKPSKPSTYYNYETVPTETSYSSLTTSNTYPSRPSTQTSYGSSSSYGYSTRPTTNPPAPTVIVLGPLGTEYTTETTQKTVTRRPTTESVRPTLSAVRPTTGSIRPSSLITKKPSVSTTITHNISTVISNVAANNNHVVSTSFISVNLKDGTTSRPTVSTAFSTEAVVAETNNEQKITTKKPTVWTTLSSWSEKPSFYLKPSTPTFNWPEENLTPVNTLVFKDTDATTTTTSLKSTTPPPCDDETAAPDDLINFPPVRNPNLNISAPISQQEKPIIIDTFNNTGYPDIEIISENDIPTPTFVEDEVLTNKVDAFVNKIVQSLQGNFQDLKDIVYNNQNVTSPSPSTVTRRPTNTTKKPVRRPTQTTKPSVSTTRRPATTKRPTVRPTNSKPLSSEKPARPSKPTTPRPRPTSSSSVTTKKPQVTTKRTRPTRRPTTTVAPITEEVLFEEEQSAATTTEITSTSEETLVTSDFRTQCGVRPLLKSGRIVGGKAASFGEWPWQVLVREATWLGLFTKNKCGGVLITDKYVITAAHCQPGFLATLVAVFGEFDLSGELEAKRSVTRNVRRVIVNRGYDPATFESDLALLELESPVQFDAHIVPICMPEDGIDFTSRMATVTGWGRLKYNGGVPSVLQEVQVPIIKNSVCQEMFQTAGHSKLILDSFLCAGYANGQKDSCEGDSGGPLVMQRADGRWFLVGTVSHGIKCASPYLPGVYMRTTYFKPWLHSITGV